MENRGGEGGQMKKEEGEERKREIFGDDKSTRQFDRI